MEAEHWKEKAKASLRRSLGGCPRMDEPSKKRWLEALRSGKYKQGKRAMRSGTHRGDVFCCLGVLADQEEGDAWVRVAGDCRYMMRGDQSFPPFEMMNSTRISANAMRELSLANDDGILSFGEIADAIEECL